MVLLLLIVCTVILGAAIYVRKSIIYVPANHCVVVTRGSESRVLRGAGYHRVNLLRDHIASFRWTFNYDDVAKTMEMHEGTNIRLTQFVMNLKSFKIVHRSQIEVEVDPNILLRVVDPIKAVSSVDNTLRLIEIEIVPILSNIISRIPIEEMATASQQIAADVKKDPQFNARLQEVGMVCDAFTIESVKFEETYFQAMRDAKLRESETHRLTAEITERALVEKQRHVSELASLKSQQEQEAARVAHQRQMEFARIEYENTQQQKAEEHRIALRRAELEREKINVEFAQVAASAAAAKSQQEIDKMAAEAAIRTDNFIKLIQAGFTPDDIVRMETAKDVAGAMFNSSKIYLPTNTATNMWLHETK